MKNSLIILSLILSVSAFASDVVYSVADSSVLTTALPMLSSATSSDTVPNKQAQMVLNDAQEYMLSGSATTFLGQKIKDVKAQNADMSESEALALLIEEAEQILSK